MPPHSSRSGDRGGIPLQVRSLSEKQVRNVQPCIPAAPCRHRPGSRISGSSDPTTRRAEGSGRKEGYRRPGAVRVTIDEAEAERRIRETFDQVEVWHRAPLFTPLVGAQLRADDDEWPHLALSQLAKAGYGLRASSRM